MNNKQISVFTHIARPTRVFLITVTATIINFMEDRTPAMHVFNCKIHLVQQYHGIVTITVVATRKAAASVPVLIATHKQACLTYC